jgi:uncharacterized membrane protein YtjA (UPF0391 family)
MGITNLPKTTKERTMLNWTISFLIIAIIAGVLGFTSIAGVAIEMAKVVFVVFLFLWIVAVVFNVVRGKGPKSVL